MTDDYIPTWNLDSIPLEKRKELLVKTLRDLGARGRKPKLEPCPHCGTQLGARERRKHRCQKASEVKEKQ